jgi:hypothetical protein
MMMLHHSLETLNSVCALLAISIKGVVLMSYFLFLIRLLKQF